MDTPVTDHDWGSWEVARNATHFKEGVTKRECSYCGKVQKKAIKKLKLKKAEKKAIAAVTSYLKAAKKYNYKKLTKSFAKASTKIGFPTEASSVKVYKKLNGKYLNWTLKRIKKSGKKYLVYANVEYPDGEDTIHDAIYKELLKAYQNGKDAEKAGVDAAKKYVKRLSKQDIYTTDKTVKFTMVKTKGKWKIEKRTKPVVDLAVCNFNSGMESATNDFYLAVIFGL